MVFEKNAPLLIFPNSFSDFNSYFKSLSNTAQKGLTSTINKNKKTIYKKIDLDTNILSNFMKLWETQQLHDGSYPLWGDWTPEYILELSKDFEVILFGLFENDELISIQFVFKWEDYINCNAPLYNKELYSEQEVSKYMWLKLVEWSIINNIKYLDLMGPSEYNTWSEVLYNRCSSNEPGDFGYKWKFIPDTVKNSSVQIDYETNSCEKCKTKWIEEVGKEKQCKCEVDKLLIVAHPDDELIFFGNWLKENRNSTKVVCVTGGNDDIRKSEFMKSMNQLKIREYEIWEFDSESEQFFNDYYEIHRGIFSLRDNKWKCVVTHSEYGEYGRLHHIELNKIVTSIFRDFPLYVYSIDNTKHEININLYDVYKSQIKHGIKEILSSECTGSDWYKHVLNHNLIEYGSIIDNNKIRQLFVNLILPKNSSYNSFINDLFISYSSLTYSEFTVVCTVDDLKREIKNKNRNLIFIFLETIYNEISLNDVINLIPYTIRTIVTDKNTRDLLGNPLNVVYLNLFSDLDKVKMSLKSNILMAREWNKINKIENNFSNMIIDNNKLHLDYNGKEIKNATIKFLDNTGTELVWYSIYLYNNSNIFFIIEQEWINKSIFVQVYNNDILNFSQILSLTKGN